MFDAHIQRLIDDAASRVPVELAELRDANDRDTLTRSRRHAGRSLDLPTLTLAERQEVGKWRLITGTEKIADVPKDADIGPPPGRRRPRDIDDMDLDEIAGLSLDAILDDPDHPLHPSNDGSTTEERRALAVDRKRRELRDRQEEREQAAALAAHHPGSDPKAYGTFSEADPAVHAFARAQGVTLSEASKLMRMPSGNSEPGNRSGFTECRDFARTVIQAGERQRARDAELAQARRDVIELQAAGLRADHPALRRAELRVVELSEVKP